MNARAIDGRRHWPVGHRHARVLFRRVQEPAARPEHGHRGWLRIEVIPFDPEDARHAGDIRATLAAQGTPIGGYDVCVALGPCFLQNIGTCGNDEVISYVRAN